MSDTPDMHEKMKLATDPEIWAPGGPVEKLVLAGHAVLSIDVRGFGETADSRSKIVYAPGDHRTAMWSMHLGKPLLGQRVEDVLGALACLPRLTGIDEAGKIDLIGVGRAAPVVLHAACLDSRIGSVTVQESIRSWLDDVVARLGHRTNLRRGLRHGGGTDRIRVRPQHDPEVRVGTLRADSEMAPFEFVPDRQPNCHTLTCPAISAAASRLASAFNAMA